jgi:hypothetical protein
MRSAAVSMVTTSRRIPFGCEKLFMNCIFLGARITVAGGQIKKSEKRNPLHAC